MTGPVTFNNWWQQPMCNLHMHPNKRALRSLFIALSQSIASTTRQLKIWNGVSIFFFFSHWQNRRSASYPYVMRLAFSSDTVEPQTPKACCFAVRVRISQFGWVGISQALFDSAHHGIGAAKMTGPVIVASTNETLENKSAVQWCSSLMLVLMVFTFIASVLKTNIPKVA